jgi:acetyl esterase
VSQVHPQAQAILDAAKEADGPPLNEMPVDEARAALDEIPKNYGLPLAKVARIDKVSIPGPAGTIDARLIVPDGAGPDPLPLLVYYHGGGWVLGHVESHIREASYLAAGAGCAVLIPDYRLAPESRFPAASDDSYVALQWAFDRATMLNIDPARIAVGGDSAGGHLAAVVTQRARDEGPKIALQVLIYPVTDTYQDTESYQTRADDYFLTRDLMGWFIDSYLNDPAERDDPRASPVRATCFDGLPPAIICTAGFDPLRDEGAAYADNLKRAGVPVEYIDYPGQIHGFISMAGAIDEGRDFMDRACVALSQSFGT